MNSSLLRIVQNMEKKMVKRVSKNLFAQNHYSKEKKFHIPYLHTGTHSCLFCELGTRDLKGSNYEATNDNLRRICLSPLTHGPLDHFLFIKPSCIITSSSIARMVTPTALMPDVMET